MLMRNPAGSREPQPEQKRRRLRLRAETPTGIVSVVGATFAVVIIVMLTVDQDTTWVLVVAQAGLVGYLGGHLTYLMKVIQEVVAERTMEREWELTVRLDVERAKDAEHMEEWQDEKTADLYEQIMSQVDRGLITCRKCAGLDD